MGVLLGFHKFLRDLVIGILSPPLLTALNSPQQYITDISTHPQTLEALGQQALLQACVPGIPSPPLLTAPNLLRWLMVATSTPPRTLETCGRQTVAPRVHASGPQSLPTSLAPNSPRWLVVVVVVQVSYIHLRIQV